MRELRLEVSALTKQRCTLSATDKASRRAGKSYCYMHVHMNNENQKRFLDRKIRG